MHLPLASIHVHMLLTLCSHRARVRWLHHLHRLHRHPHLWMLQRALEIHPHQNALQGCYRWRGILKLTSIIPYALKQRVHPIPTFSFNTLPFPASRYLRRRSESDRNGHRHRREMRIRRCEGGWVLRSLSPHRRRSWCYNTRDIGRRCELLGWAVFVWISCRLSGTTCSFASATPSIWEVREANLMRMLRYVYIASVSTDNLKTIERYPQQTRISSVSK